MADRKQLKILKQGVEAWNAWREEHPDAKIDLRRAELGGFGTDWRGANFQNADIRGANFRFASLEGVNFNGANLGLYQGSRTHIYITCFDYSDLTGASFDNVFLDNVSFSHATLDHIPWRDVQGINEDDPEWLDEHRFNNTILADRDVRKLLVSGNVETIPLYEKNLQGAYLVEFDLRDQYLSGTDLRKANLSGADITGSILYNTARENWIIDDIRCDYIYWDEFGQKRTPSDRDFRPGEFEELYKQLPTFEYIFEQGFTPLDPLVMDRVVQAINERHKEFKLDLINFDKRGEPHATFTVCQLDFVDTAKEQVSAVYEANRIQPENQDQLMAAFMGLIENQSKSLDIIKQLGGSKMGDTYNISGGQVGAVGKSAISTGNTFQQIVTDLSRLHEEMQRTASTPEQQAAAQDVAKAEQAARQEDESTMRQHLKSAGQWALDCAQQIGTDVVTEYLKKMTTGM
ncbi:MAG: pentapeptide repeat-containing protein [Candidatus Electrothrix scaldis]|nr:MAG: pentapeptide repeat-containing protein [Candidatus Electrothrix sp. GW3-3]